MKFHFGRKTKTMTMVAVLMLSVLPGSICESRRENERFVRDSVEPSRVAWFCAVFRQQVDRPAVDSDRQLASSTLLLRLRSIRRTRTLVSK